MNFKKKIPIFFVCFLIFGCVNKPFQPSPPSFEMWVKNNASQDDVKRELMDCGYPSIYGYAGVQASAEQKTKSEQCMLKKGFGYRDGYKGICVQPNRPALAACGDKK